MIAATDDPERLGGKRRHWLAPALLCLLLFGTAARAQTPAAMQAYKMPQQPLEQALAELAAAADLQILMAPQMLRGKTAPALSGRYSAAEALQQLLAGSGLSYRLTDSGVVTIVAAPKPLPAAAAKPAQPRLLPQVATSLGALQVTGSRIRRSEFEGAAPLTVISAEQMEREGRFSLAEVLAINGMSVYGAESQSGGGRFSANAQPVNLRGLGAGRALILVDGRRVPDYPFPSNGRSNFQSLGSIPLAGVDRVEVMTGGASAVYGADAIAGVINIVLKQPRDGHQLKLRTGTSTQGGADRVDMHWSAGFSGQDWRADYVLQFAQDELLRGYQRGIQVAPQSAAGPQPALGLGVEGEGGVLQALPAGVCERWDTAFVDWNYAAAPGQAHGWGCGTWRNAGYASLADARREISGRLHAERDLPADIQLWTTVQLRHARSEIAAVPETITGPHSSRTGRVNLVQDPQLGLVSPLRVLTPQEMGGLAPMNDRYAEQMADLALGLRGDAWKDMEWNLTLGHSDYRLQRDFRRLLGAQVNAFFFGQAQGFTDDGVIIQPLNLDHWYRPLTTGEYRAMSATVQYRARSQVDSASYVLSGDIAELKTGKLGMALVLEASHQSYALQNRPSVLPLQLELYDLAGSVGAGGRSRYALGGEARIPLASTLKLNLAGRWDKYDDSASLGITPTWSAGLEWRPLAGLLLRASHATSFKVPDMHWTYTDGGGSFGSAVDVLRCMQAGANPDCAAFTSAFLTRTSRNPGLGAESGVSSTLGVVWDAAEAMSMSLDYWDVRSEQGIGRIAPLVLLRDEAECSTGMKLDGSPSSADLRSWECRKARARVVRSGGGVGRIVMVESMAANQSNERVRGLDAVVDARMDTAAGQFALHSAWSRMLHASRRVRAPGTLHEQWRQVPWQSGENRAFRSNFSASLGWQGTTGWSANLFGIRYGSLPRVDGNGRLPPLFLWNANIGKRLTEQAAVTLFVNNVFDTPPPRDSSNAKFPYYYDDVYSAVGRQLAVQLDYNFD
ncbi:TonB-dependent receptor [Stenotrophomonas terrae]|uniref:TonB-dependent receptor n=1 Tax=Stenotrophomonas terrae TaxID=405446 RepID=UPI0032084414